MIFEIVILLTVLELNFSPEDVEGLTNFIIDNFKRHYYSNRAPFGFYVHAAWFVSHENAFEAYLLFLDYLQTLPDVMIVSASQVLDWVRNPIPMDDILSNPVCHTPEETKCIPQTCLLSKGNQERWMTTCAESCPRVYPWCENPLGV